MPTIQTLRLTDAHGRQWHVRAEDYAKGRPLIRLTDAAGEYMDGGYDVGAARHIARANVVSAELIARSFEDWIRELDEDVIQGEFGYEPGEFAVYPEHWRALFAEGLMPAQAWQRAMDEHYTARREQDRRRAENWSRIQAEDSRHNAVEN